jgi:hypothetical protein
MVRGADGDRSSMDAASFAALFDEFVAGPAGTVGYEPWGKNLWFEDGDLCAALLRTERRYNWPFAFTFAIGHTFLRTFLDDTPLRRSHNVPEYPLTLQPSEARRFVDRPVYEPANLLSWPRETMRDGAVEQQLEAIGRALVSVTPRLATRFTPAVMLALLESEGENAWAERRWIEDYRRAADRGS